MRTFFLTLLIAYGVLALILAALQRPLIYPGTSRDGRAWDAPPSGFETVEVEASDGLALNALWKPPADGGRVLVFFHGNGDSAHNMARWVGPALGEGDGALLSSYRGYAGNPGAPSEDGLTADGEGALAFVRAQGIEDARIIPGGISIGTGVASHVATLGEFAGLAMVAPFTSLPDAASDQLWWLPAGLLVVDRYPTIDRIGEAKGDLLIVHGSADTIIAADHSRRLAKARPDARLEIVEGAGHNDIGGPASAILADWLAATR